MLFSGECKERVLTNVSDVEQIVECATGNIRPSRSAEAHENIAVCLFLIVGVVRYKIALPIKVLRREAPDFVLSSGIEREPIGLEHTRATSQKYMMDMSVFEQYPEGSLLELPFYSPNSRLPKKSRIAMRKPGEKLRSVGWGDYGMEKDWIVVMSGAIEQKTQLLNKEHYEKFRSNELIVEDESHVSFGKRLGKSISMLRENHSRTTPEGPLGFDKVHIITEGHLIYDVFGGALETSIQKTELHEMWQQYVRKS